MNQLNVVLSPDIFKISCVTPIHKSGDTTDPSNYRPISVLPALNKVLERVVYDQLLNFLDKHHIIKQLSILVLENVIQLNKQS